MVSVVFCRRHRCVLFRSFQSKMHQKQNFFQKPRSAPSSSFRNNLDVLRGNERSASWKAILRNPSRRCQEIWGSIPQQTTKRRNYQFIRSCRRCKVRSDSNYPERLDFPSLNFYGEKRKKIPGFESVAEMLFDERFSCLLEEISKEAQTFIKAVGDFLRSRSVFCLLGFARSTRHRNLKSFSIILTRCTITPTSLTHWRQRMWIRS